MYDIRYSVYDGKTDLPIIINGTIPQCAKVLGILPKTFKQQASRQRNMQYKYPNRIKYRIYREKQEDEA